MTKKLLHVVVMLLTTFSLFSQAPGYFGKSFYASVGIETDLVKLENGSVAGFNLEVGKLPEWEVPNMITKYYTTIEGYKMAKVAKQN